ncbi:MAG: bifunctional phosphopantothenoylcysteine decarboxylase/phosphopantothenate--cysteine ligase CoaBC [Parvibaculaceae bacterium]|nr:bifunctional phosphopantothenoylcysteine decarboxylase/phosphopantothenate--cysteine ligase CoaBC [Parvibaculaceae bacterium]
MTPLHGKRILLIIGGGIAAYKTLELIRRLRDKGVHVRALMTKAAHEFVTPLSVSSLTGEKVYTDLFDLTDEAEMGHIQLSRDADLLLVAPATADLMARMVAGMANDLATTALLATDKPVMVAPAMNVRMWEHKATQRNIAQLAQDGVGFIGPDDGDMACGEFGPGRFSETPDIIAAVENHFRASSEPLSGSLAGPLAGRHILVTSGPTHEPIDPVRYLANRSSGKQGHAIAGSLARLGAQVTLVAGPTTQPNPAGVTVVQIETAREMLAACQTALPADGVICAAAVADWRVAQDAEQKMKKGPDGVPALALTENPDILATISQLPKGKRPALVVGFAAETEKVIEHATAKLARKKCDWLVANDVSPASGVMGGDMNTVHVLSATGRDDWPQLSKTEVAERLARKVADYFST